MLNLHYVEKRDNSLDFTLSAEQGTLRTDYLVLMIVFLGNFLHELGSGHVSM